jgi:hypothetical protein
MNPRTSEPRNPRTKVWLLALALAGYLAGTAALAWTRMPQPDEGHFANAGYELAFHGRLAMPMWTEWVSSLDRHMYVQMPLYYVQLAAWVKAFGFGLRAVRMNSVLWGFILVLAWGAIVRALTREWIAGLLGVVLIGFNYDIMNMTSARYDPMCAALSAAGVACYLVLRERHLIAAVLAANGCLAAAVLTHPFGVIGLIGFGVFFLALDLRRMSVAVVASAVTPYAIAAAGWGVYILQDPVAFKAQLAANAHGRVAGLSHPLQLLALELRERYLERFGGWRADVPVLMRVKVLILAAYLAAGVACLVVRDLRRRPEVLALAAWAALAFGVIAIADSNRWYIYLLHAIPIYTAVLAIWGAWLLSRGAWRKYAVAAGVAGWVLFAVGTVALRVRLDDYGRLYVPTLAYLQSHAGPRDLIMAGGEFGPGLGFEDRVLDDPKFGFRNGKSPDWIVYDKLHDERMEEWARTTPALVQHIREVLSGYQLVLDNRQPYNYYRVYRRPQSDRRIVER